MSRVAIEFAVVLVCLAAAGFTGWKVRDLSADRQTADAAFAASAAALTEANRQADIHANVENFLRDQLDRANAANAGVHLGAVRCSVSVRDPLAGSGLPAPDTAATRSDAGAASGDAAAGVGEDIGPALDHWAGGQLTDERERLRACQRYASEVSAP